MILFSLKRQDAPEKLHKEAMEKLYEVICGSLRASDVVTQRGGNAVLVLLLEANKNDSRMVVDRVLSRWKQTNYPEEVVYEMETIRL